MKLSPDWQGSLNNFEDALKIVNDLNWNISFMEQSDGWMLFAGEKLIGTFENRSEMETFILGMALALGVLPPEIVNEIRKFVE